MSPGERRDIAKDEIESQKSLELCSSAVIEHCPEHYDVNMQENETRDQWQARRRSAARTRVCPGWQDLDEEAAVPMKTEMRPYTRPGRATCGIGRGTLVIGRWVFCRLNE